MSLMYLPNEILIAIAAYHRDDLATLSSLSLVGNHRLLDISRPLLLHIVQLEWDGTTRGVDAQHSLVELQSNAAYSDLIHGLHLAFRGPHKQEHMKPATLQNLGKFLNLTHLSLSFIGFVSEDGTGREYSEPNSVWPTLHTLLKALAENLIGLHLEGLARPADWNDAIEFAYIPKDLPTLRHLRHLSIVFCPIYLASLWEKSPSIEVCELRAGNFETYWSTDKRRLKNRDTAAGYSLSYCPFNWLPLDVMSHCPEHLSHFLTLRRLCMVSDDREPRRDAGTLLNIFHEVFSSPFQSNLVELVLEIPASAYQLSVLVGFPNASFPQLMRLWIRTEVDVCDCGDSVSQEPISFTAFPSLTDLWLPMDCIACEDPGGHFTFSSLPSLCRLYLNGPKVEPAFETPLFARSIAAHIGGHVPLLESVTWVSSVSIALERDASGDILTEVVGTDSQRPAWTRFREKWCC